MSFLYNFPDELLEILFQRCDVYTLLQLNSVCRRFYQISKDILIKKTKHLLVTNEMSEKFRERCKPLLSSWNSKFNIYYNWKNGIYKNKYVRSMTAKQSIQHRKCLEMTRNTVWFYRYTHLHAYNRGEDGNINEDFMLQICKFPFSCIAYCNDIIISGHSDGSIRAWKIESRDKYIRQLKTHFHVYTNNVLNIEATTQHIISSSRGLINIQKNIFEEDGSVEKKEIYNSEKLVQSISLDPTETKLAVSAEKLFLIYDINENRQTEQISGDTCIQLLWQDPQTILMLYEHHIKKIDTRNMEFVRTWNTSFISEEQKLYSFSSDNLYTILTGTSDNMVILWDQRLSDPVQTYNLYHDNINIFYNIACSVQFDSTHIYTVTRQQDLTELDFKGAILDHASRAKRKEFFSNIN